MKNLIVILIIVFNIASCNKHIQFDESLIHIISEDQEFPQYYSSLFFGQGEKTKILLDPRELKELYNENSYSMDYKSFLRKVLNQQLIIKSKDKGYAFDLEKSITEEYQHVKFTDFLNFYCKKGDNDIYTLKSGFSENQRNTIFYYFFINNYLTEFDDYMGFYYIFSTSIYSKEDNVK
jgi:hypothetical protein